MQICEKPENLSGQTACEPIPIYAIGDGTGESLPFFAARYGGAHSLSPLHRHCGFQINYILRGKLLHRVNNSFCELVRGDIFVIPPMVPHQLLPCGNNDFEVVEMEFEAGFVFDGAAREGVLTDYSYIRPFLVKEEEVRPRLSLTGSGGGIKAEALIEDILEEFGAREDSYLAAIRADLLKLLVLIGRAFRDKREDSAGMRLFNYHRDAMSDALDYINANLTRPISIESAARRAMLSESYFSALFKMLTNRTFVEYVHEKRIQRAMALLRNTDERVMDVCHSCGFNNVNHFNRVFRALVGVAPSQYRSSCRCKVQKGERE